MLKLKKIAVTGLVSSGKSTACHIMGLLGAYVISCDAISKELLKDPSVIKKLVSLFGETILKDKKINHATLADIVFEDREKLKKLELLLHPLIFEEMKSYYQLAQKTAAKAFVVEAPLLFEANIENFFDAIITIDSKKETCENRFLNMGKNSLDFARRCANQWSLEKKKQFSTHIIENNSDLKTFEKETKKVFHNILSL
jgi:dephospho-CoA kinase